MNHSPSEIIAKMLVDDGYAVFDQNLATGSKWKVHVLIVPDDPPRVITVYDTTGIKDGRIMAGITIIHPGWQIMIRALSADIGWWMAKRIFDYSDTILRKSVQIDARTVETVLLPASTYRVQGLYKTGSVQTAGQDEKRRFLFTVNGTTTIAQTA